MRGPAFLYVAAMLDPELRAHIEASGWVSEMGLHILSAGPDEVIARLDLSAKHHQGYGIVHGGVHCGVVETLASVGAAAVAHPRGQRVVGLDNHTSFIRAVSEGTLSARAIPVTRGRTTQVWAVELKDEEGRLVARGQVRLLCLPAERTLG
ncbi:MAG: PaaI family thioesterase [Candidatus Dormibacteraeota bacterium]|nr:PaaI family thioesterase [Candidatus Dormibacteraeota bacterium]